MPKLIFHNEDLAFEVKEGTNLRKAALEHGINLYPPMQRLLNCHGHGLCGTCKVQISDPGAVSPRAKTKAEKRKTFDAPLWEKIRLACQTRVVGDLVVTTYPRLPIAWYNFPTYQHLRSQSQ
jgi:ferredoxin